MRYLFTFSFFMLPTLVFAQGAPKDFKGFVDIILDINQTLVYLIFALTFIVLAWAVVNTWILNAGDEASIAKGKQIITVGVVVLVIMSGIWGILALLRAGIFGL